MLDLLASVIVLDPPSETDNLPVYLYLLCTGSYSSCHAFPWLPPVNLPPNGSTYVHFPAPLEPLLLAPSADLQFHWEHKCPSVSCNYWIHLVFVSLPSHMASRAAIISYHCFKIPSWFVRYSSRHAMFKTLTLPQVCGVRQKQ